MNIFLNELYRLEDSQEVCARWWKNASPTGRIVKLCYHYFRERPTSLLLGNRSRRYSSLLRGSFDSLAEAFSRAAGACPEAAQYLPRSSQPDPEFQPPASKFTRPGPTG